MSEPGPAPPGQAGEAPARPRSRLELARSLPGWRGAVYRVPVLGAVAYVVSPPRTRPPSILRRALSYTSVALAVLGIGMVAYPAIGHRYPSFYRIPVERAIEWTNVLSDLHANKLQDRLKKRFVAVTRSPLAVGPVREGDPLTRLEIPKLGVDTIVVEGVSLSALKAGAGHYPQTPLPGKPGNVAIAGHRTTYGRPFNRIDELRPGDKIVLTTPVGVFTYEVSRDPWVTTPEDFGVLDPTPDAVLTLTTCHPKGSAKQRLIVRAKLVRSEPLRLPKKRA